MLTYSGYYAIGIKDIFDMIDRYRQFTVDTGYFDLKRQRQAKWWMYETVNETLKNSFYDAAAVKALQAQTEQDILQDHITPFMGAQRLLTAYYAALRNGEGAEKSL